MRGGLSPCQLGCTRRTETCDQLLEDAKAKPRTLLGVFVLILGLLVALPVSAAVAGDTRPNIVVLMIDDLAVLRDQRLWNRLPHIKSLFVDHGITFKHAIGETSLCCPGRAGFLGGQHTRHHGVTYNDARLFDPTNTIATALHDAGYTTLLSGKYLNLMDLLDNRFPPGWDHFAGIGDGYYDYDEFVDGVTIHHAHLPQDYSTRVFRTQALTWLRAAPAAQPLFLYLAPFAPHGDPEDGFKPTGAPQDRGSSACWYLPPWKPPSYNEADVSDKPAWIAARPLLPYPNGWDLRRTCESMLAVDRMLAAVENEMAAQGRTDTLYLLVDDNGMDFGQHRLSGKTTPYSTPIPLMASWSRRGLMQRVETSYVSNIDIGPTLAEVAGTTMPQADGISFAPLLTDQPWSPTRDAILIDMPPADAVPDRHNWSGLWTTDGHWL